VRAARPVRGRLLKVILWFNDPRVILKFYPMIVAEESGRAGKTFQCDSGKPQCSKRVRDLDNQVSNPPAGTGPKPHKANRVKSSSGSVNVCWRRESGRGDTDQPENNYLRGFAEGKKQTMNSSTMRGASSPCQSVCIGDGAETGKVHHGRVREKLLYSFP